MIELKNINLSYHKVLIQDGTLSLPESSITAIIGKSGNGKTTLLNQIGFIDHQWYKHCNYYVNDHLLNQKEAYDLYRNDYFYLFQNNNLVEEMTCYDNIVFLATMRGIQVDQSTIFSMFDKLNVDIDLTQYPNQISGGQRQKLEMVMLAIIQPKVIICDEITSALDFQSAIEIFSMLKKIVKETNAICVIVTHDPKMIQECDQIYLVSDGKLTPQKVVETHLSDLKATSSRMNIKTYLMYTYLKLTNKSFLEKSLVVGLLFSIMIASFNLLYRYNSDNKVKLKESMLSESNQEFIFDASEDLSFDTINFYEIPQEVTCKDVNYDTTLYINDSYEELSKYMVIKLLNRGIYINVSFADALGVTSTSNHRTITFTYNNQEYTYDLAGVVEDEYFQGNMGYSIYFPYEQDLIEVDEPVQYMMYYQEDTEHLADTVNELESHNITIYSAIKDYSSMMEHNKTINLFINLLLGAVVVILAVFSIIYSIIQYEAKKKEITLLYNRGFRLGSLSFLNMSENIPIVLMIIIISPFISYYVSKILESNYIYITRGASILPLYILISLLTALLVIGLSQFMISLIYISVRKKQ